MSQLWDDYSSGGLPAVRQQLAGQPLAEQVKAVNKLLCEANNDHHDQAAVRNLVGLAEELAEGSEDYDVLSALKAVCFNMAAFHWRGWGDNRSVTKEQESAARPYADRNLQLAVSLDKGDIPRSRAEWLVGAFCVAADDLDGAVEWFSLSESSGVSNEDALERKMVRAYRMLAAKEPGTEDLLKEIEAAPDGSFYAGQVRSCANVYGLEIL